LIGFGRGQGWNLITGKETPFAIDLKTGLRPPAIFP
jgi:hypothetical protein